MVPIYELVHFKVDNCFCLMMCKSNRKDELVRIEDINENFVLKSIKRKMKELKYVK